MKSVFFLAIFFASCIALPFQSQKITDQFNDCCPKEEHKSVITPSFTDSTKQLKQERDSLIKDRLKKQKAIERMLNDEAKSKGKKP